MFFNNSLYTQDLAYKGLNLTWMQPVPFNINSSHFELFTPELTLLYFLVFLLLISVYLRKFYRKEDLSVFIFKCSILLFILVISLLYNFIFKNYTCIIFNFTLVFDYYSTIIKFLITLVTILTLLSSFQQIVRSYIDTVEYTVIVGFCLLFMFTLISSFNMIAMYLSIEGLSLLLYVLAVYPFTSSSWEAAVKYFTSGSTSSGLLLFGVLSIYGATGAFSFLAIKLVLLSGMTRSCILAYMGVTLILFGFSFKLGAFPYHNWALDVYEGTWLPVTTFFMLAVKMCIFFFLTRLFNWVFLPLLPVWQGALLVSSIGSLYIGATGALSQSNLKRLFGYSSISQIGFALLSLVTGSIEGIQASFLFILIYFITSLGIFIILLNTNRYLSGDNLATLTDLANFGHNNMLMALCMTLMLFSMAGIPPLVGFFSKYYIFKTLISSSLYELVIYGIYISVINVFAYIRVLKFLLYGKFIVDIQNMDFFFFCCSPNIYYIRFSMYISVFLITLFVCAGSFFIEMLLNNLGYLGESAILLFTIH